MHVFVTGAGGYIGRFLVRQLQQQGNQVSALYRPWMEKQPPEQVKNNYPHGIRPVYLDIQESTDWPDILQGADTVVHLADGLRAYESMKTSPGFNHEARTLAKTLNLARAAARSGVKTFLYMSSLKAVSGEYANDILTEASTPNGERSIYGQMKARMEAGLFDLAAREDMPVISLRPPLVYGPQAGGNFARLLKLADTGWPLPFGGLKQKRSMIFIDNLCSAIETAIQHSDTRSAAYFIHDGTPFSVAQIFKTSRKQLGRPVRLFTVPLMLSGPLWAARLPVAKPIFERLAKPLVVNDTRFRQDFSWQAPVDSHKALQITLNSLKPDHR